MRSPPASTDPVLSSVDPAHSLACVPADATPALSSASAADSLTRPKGNYLCGYQKGVWSRLPLLYEAMTEYAEQNGLTLSGYAYEVGMNEFMISAPDEYITKVMILIQENV